MECARVVRRLEYFEKKKLWLSDDTLINGLEMFKELFHVGGIDIDGDMETESSNWCHVEDGFKRTRQRKMENKLAVGASRGTRMLI